MKVVTSLLFFYGFGSIALLADLYPHVIVSGLFATNITRVDNPPKLNQQQMALILREGFMLDVFGNHEHLTGRQLDRSILELDCHLLPSTYANKALPYLFDAVNCWLLRGKHGI
jgi:hypothetical protein